MNKKPKRMEDTTFEELQEELAEIRREEAESIPKILKRIWKSQEEEEKELEERLEKERFDFHIMSDQVVDSLVDIYNNDNVTKEKVKMILDHIDKNRHHVFNIKINTSKTNPHIIHALSTKLWVTFKDAGITINFENITNISRLMYLLFEQNKDDEPTVTLIRERLKNGKFEYEEFLPIDK